MMNVLEIQYSTSTAFASGIIRRLTHSKWSHVDLVLPGEGLLGVSGKDASINDVGGVCIRNFHPWAYKEPPKTARVHCTDTIARNIVEFARSQIGKPFDNGALYAFLKDRAGVVSGNRDWRDLGSYFCSELVVLSLEKGGLFNYPLVVTKDTVSPQDSLLIINPFMTPDNIAEFI